jgi:hypothetical protein
LLHKIKIQIASSDDELLQMEFQMLPKKEAEASTPNDNVTRINVQTYFFV